jgi:hypothetical protein
MPVTLEDADREELGRLWRTHRSRRCLPCRSPVVEETFREPVPSSDDLHPASFGLDLRQKRRLLLHRPLPASLDPPDDLNCRQTRLLLELQKEAPEDRSISDHYRRRHTSETGRLPGGRFGLPSESRRAGFAGPPVGI